jgi:hypothetical protein
MSGPDPTKVPASKRRKRERKPDPVDALPFVGIKDDGRSRNNWAPTSTGDDIQDYLLGLKYVDDALDCALSEEGSCLPDFIIMDMLSSLGARINERNMELAFLVRLAGFAEEGARFLKAWRELPPGQSLRYTKPYAEAEAAS